MILFPFRYKLGIAIGVLSVIVSGSTLFYFFKQVQDAVWIQMGYRLEDVGRTSAAFMSDEDLKSILAVKKMLGEVGGVTKESFPEGPGEYNEILTDEQMEKIHSSPEFQHVVQFLRKIKIGTKKTYPEHGVLQQEPFDPAHPVLLRYAYILTKIQQSPDGNVVQFIADADYTEFDYNSNGKIEENEESTTSGTLFDVSEYPALLQSFQGNIESDSEYTVDTFGVFLSSYIPVKDNNGEVVAIIGLDMKADDEYNMINQVFYLYIGLVAVSVFFSITVAVFIAGFMTRPLNTLRVGAEQVKNRDFDTVMDIKTNDEMELLASAFNDMVAEIRNYSESMEKQNQAFFRFVPNQFLQILGKKSAMEIAMGDSNRNRMTILFSDIRSFTSISEGLTPEDNLKFLNEYIQRMEPAIKSVGGFVDKFVGDGIMALFIDTDSGSSASNAVRAAITMREELNKYNTERQLVGNDRIEMGIGISTGDVILGTVGSSSRLDTTVIGNTVNVASRLESLTAQYRLPVLVSEDTIELLSEQEKESVRLVDMVIVKGQTRTIKIYEIFGYESENALGHKIKSKEVLYRAMDEYRKGNFEQAMEGFQNAKAMTPNDVLPVIYMNRCKKYLEQGTDEHWDGILRLTRK